jgi:hypothetical protein
MCKTEEQVEIKEYILALLSERDLRYSQRFEAQEKAMNLSLFSAKEAVTKAEAAAEKRFESVNEFRNTLSDQQRNLMPRTESEVKFDSINTLIDNINARLNKTEGVGSGLSKGWIILLGFVGLIGGIIGIISFLTR